MICALVCECLCVLLSLTRQCIKAGMWASGVSKSFLIPMTSISLCLFLSLPLFLPSSLHFRSSPYTSVMLALLLLLLHLFACDFLIYETSSLSSLTLTLVLLHSLSTYISLTSSLFGLHISFIAFCLLLSSLLSADHNRPETSVYRQSHRDIGLGTYGCCHYCSGPGGEVRSI